MANKARIEPSFDTFAAYRDIGDLLGMHEQTGGEEPGNESGPPREPLRLRSLSFNSMAEKLGIAPSTVAACVEALELAVFGESRSTGVRGAKPDGKEGLFRIKGRDAEKTFTESGIDVYWQAVKFLRLHQTFGGKTPQRREVVTIGSFNSLLSSYIPLALKQFLTADDRPVFRLPEIYTPEIFEAVKYRRVDFAIGSVPSPRDAAFADRKVMVESLGLEIERGLVVHPEHRLARKRGIVPEDLSREVVFRSPHRMTTPDLETWYDPDYNAGGDVVEVQTLGVMLQFVKHNLGVGIAANMPGEVEDAVECKKVQFHPLAGMETAKVAAYLPEDGLDSLTPVAKRVYSGVAEYFSTLAAAKRSKRKRKND